MTSSIRSVDSPVEPSMDQPSTASPSAASPFSAATAEAPELLEESAAIASAVIELFRQFTGIKSRVTSSPEGDHSPMFLLVKLAHYGPSRASDLAELLCADPSTVSRQVASLVKIGLLERRADPDDGRASILVPTELGLARVEELRVRRALTMQPVIEDWSPEDRADLLRLIQKYTKGIEAHREEIISIMLEHHGRHEQWKETR
jgi:DNA-binding MarR family transcriptional regulator